MVVVRLIRGILPQSRRYPGQEFDFDQ